MKTITNASFVVAFALALFSSGCGKSAPPVPDTSPALQQAFESAAPALKERIASVATDLKAQKFIEVTKALDEIVAGGKLTEAQEQAISSTILEINEAAANNPKLDTPEMYQLRSQMFQRLRRSGR